MKIKGGFTNYGEPVGILMLETKFARPIGDIGHAETFDFPVRYQVVRGASPRRVVEERDPALLEPFITAARRLQDEGVKAVTTSCGFLVLFQEAIAGALDIPFFSSSLLQIPLAYRLAGHTGRVGVLTARKASLTREHFRCAGAEDIPLAVEGMDDGRKFSRVFLNSSTDPYDSALDLDYPLCDGEIRSAARRLKDKNPDIRSVVLECTNMPPFRRSISEETDLPIFDIVTLTRYIKECCT